jgi:cobalt-zinc-cadmium resistance protein CzcA
MIKKIIDYSINHKLMVCLLVITIIAGGLWAMKTISVDSTPDITNNQVQVITVAQNLSTTDIEQFITYPVEMAMANLPGVEDVRSVSRFGLSLVTVIFKDNMGTYLPRQLVQEKLGTVREEIPKSMGSPEMGPITTGLGEIYLYSLEADTTLYTPQELRTLQDWTVRRQLSMIPGVVEVNSMGGSIKQYEITFSPDRLNAAGVSIAQIFDALEKNNVNTGGAYIEKDHQSHFIRGEGVIKNINDIRNIVIKNMPDGMPVTVGDVADDVRYGSQVRYGAFTKDGHEAVGGAIMMLKGSNSNKVIDDVKKRVAEVQRTLPPGVRIEPFLDRSELIGRTTSTIARNLIEGALIVVFVLVLLLGSIRGGIITASLIPLSLLFAFILMRFTGVWANLMSLGAIDFGIIVDGAVIIVEGTVHELERYLKTTGFGKSAISQATVNRLTGKAAGSMMHSAFFGQIIILMVFTPILFLSGVSGKMFQPMAFTFAYALLGAILLCLTYVPMMTAVLNGPVVSRWQWLRKAEATTVHVSRWIMKIVYQLYRPALRLSLKYKTAVISLTLAVFAGTAVLFSRMGAEFIPSLDEGDIAFQLFLRPGSSLSETIKRETEVERVLLKEFPEVKTVCGRIGVSAVPNDPMGMDFTDSFIILEKDKSKWKSAKSKKELLTRIEARLEQIPGISCAFSQPVELRTNELMTGIREDVAVKVYGEDIDTLNAIGHRLEHLIADIPGAKDVAMERTSGLPQITVSYDRAQLAKYGLDVEKLNQYISTAFAGGYAGEVFDGEKRFSLVLRLSDKNRSGISDIRDLLVDLPNGEQIPMSELADISYRPGPMQISRDGASRRVYVGLNARGRDVASVVADIDKAIRTKLQLPSGYRITYDGSFRNLQEATSRMAVVVPVALLIIFLLLYFALQSVVEAMMIYAAVPLATLGGVIALALRGMPFSISAGVGFIVLSGVAVLNGLVLINRFNSLEKEGMNSVARRIYRGTQERLRPIMLTAAAAMLGFLPMAVSASAGAEVQRPLATVVIGGLFTSTMLTLVLLPVLYALLKGKREKIYKIKARTGNDTMPE